MASSIDFTFPSMSIQAVFKNADTFSNTKNFGLISLTIFIDSTTKEFLFISLFFFKLATDIPWQGGVAITTSTLSNFSFFSHIFISLNNFFLVSSNVISPQI